MGARPLLFALATSRALAGAVERSPALQARAWRSARPYVAGPGADDALAARAGAETETDRAYPAPARRLGAGSVDLALATHDGALRDELLTDLPHARCELLLGVRGEEARALARQGRSVRLYVPYGADWFRYLMRRRAEAQGA